MIDIFIFKLKSICKCISYTVWLKHLFVLYNSIFQTICCSDENPCESFNKTCEYTCDPTEQKCLCPIGYQLAEDEENCIGNNQYTTCKR